MKRMIIILLIVLLLLLSACKGSYNETVNKIEETKYEYKETQQDNEETEFDFDVSDEQKKSSGQYCGHIKVTGTTDQKYIQAAEGANKEICPYGETCEEVGDCTVTIAASDATLWDCDGICV